MATPWNYSTTTSVTAKHHLPQHITPHPPFPAPFLPFLSSFPHAGGERRPRTISIPRKNIQKRTARLTRREQKTSCLSAPVIDAGAVEYTEYTFPYYDQMDGGQELWNGLPSRDLDVRWFELYSAFVAHIILTLYLTRPLPLLTPSPPSPWKRLDGMCCVSDSLSLPFSFF